jgi:dTDP-4-amino-4,6-dideoxygalactose transaminase
MSANPSLRELAISGAAPAFATPKHVGQPNIGNRKRLLARLKGMIDRRILTNNGPLAREFEQAIAAKMHVKECVAVTNATVALQLAVRALKLSGEVIMPSFTFIATAHSVAWEGIAPVFCDIDRKTHAIDPRRIESLITDRTTAILGVHVWGNPCDISAIETIARRHKLRVIYDGAHAMGCSYRGQMLGAFGDAEVLSFHATKAMNSFEGGAILTNDRALADDLRLMRNFGFAGTDRVTLLGVNAKMCEACAAMGLTSLESFERFCARNRRNYELYHEGLSRVPGVRLHQYDANESHNYHYIIVECDNAAHSLSRDEFVHFLETENVLARRYFYPGCHKMEPYASSEPDASLRLANTEWLTARVMALPNGTAVSAADIRKICGLLKVAQENAHWVRAHLLQLPRSLPGIPGMATSAADPHTLAPGRKAV